MSIAKQMAFRVDFGLSATDETIVRVDADPRASSDEYGVALMPDELADLYVRGVWRDELASIYAYAAAESDVFAGFYIDQQAGGTLHVEFIDDPDGHRDAIAKLVPPGMPFAVDRVSHSLADLQATRDAIDAADDKSGIPGGFVEMWTDIPMNQIQLGVRVMTPQVESDLIKAFGSGMAVHEAKPADMMTCTAHDCDPPWKGGLEITDYGPVSYGCSICFSAVGSLNTHVLTAGHCAGGDIGSLWQEGLGRQVVGDMRASTFRDFGTTADAAKIMIDPSNKSTDIILGAGTLRTMTRVQGHDVDVIGDRVCQAGAFTGLWCGNITAVDYQLEGTAYGFNYKFRHLRKADFSVRDGDSGGPVFDGQKAMGLVEGRAPDGRAMYSHIWEVQQLLNVTVVTQ
jgi:hypothetical protein